MGFPTKTHRRLCVCSLDGSKAVHTYDCPLSVAAEKLRTHPLCPYIYPAFILYLTLSHLAVTVCGHYLEPNTLRDSCVLCHLDTQARVVQKEGAFIEKMLYQNQL